MKTISISNQFRLLDINFKVYTLLFIFLSGFSHVFAQSQADIAKLVPSQVVNLKKAISPIPNYIVNISIIGDIPETMACQPQSLSLGGLKLELNWYNKNDETGKMMLGLVSNKSDIEKNWASHKKQIDEIYQHYSAPGNSISCSQVKEEDVPGGKLYLVEYSYSLCDTNRDKQHTVQAKCFFFNGSVNGNIEIISQCKPEEVREMVKSIIKSASEFSFSSLMQ